MLQSLLRNVSPLLAKNRAPAVLNTVRAHGMGSHVSDNDPEVIEKAQERQHQGKTKSHFPKDAPGWEEVLASDSEAIVKSERASNKTIKEMQEETIECLHEDMEEGPDKIGRSTGTNA